MRLFEPVPQKRTIPSRLSVKRMSLKTELTLAEDMPRPGAGLVTNFKAWLIAPRDNRSVTIPTDRGGVDIVQITGQECCNAFFRELRARFQQAGRTIKPSTRIRVSQPSFADLAYRKSYQDAVRSAGNLAGFAQIDFFNEPDAVFEYFRILRRDLKSASEQPLNVLVIDFGGGTCNVSAVTTTRLGERWERAVAPLAAEAPQAGGLQIDRALLLRALKSAGLADLNLTPGSNERRALDQWRDSHMSEIEALKRAVSRTAKPHRISIGLDGALAKFAGGKTSVQFELTVEDLRRDASMHWQKDIKKAVEAVLQKMQTRLVVTAKRKDVPADQRELITHVLIAGGSSQLPGFVDLVTDYFKPHQPLIRAVGQDYPFAVSAGMALNYLSQAKLITDSRVPVDSSQDDPTSDAIFLPAFESDVLFYWRAANIAGAGFEKTPMFSASKSSWEILQSGPRDIVLSLPKNMPRRQYGRAAGKPIEYQIAYDTEGVTKLSSRRFNLLDRFFDVPPEVSNPRIKLRVKLAETVDKSLEIVGDFLAGDAEKKFASLRAPVFMVADRLPRETAAGSALDSSGLFCEGVDMICIDFGTSNTTIVDLASSGEVSAGDFWDEPYASIPVGKIEPVEMASGPNALLSTSQKVKAVSSRPTPTLNISEARENELDSAGKGSLTDGDRGARSRSTVGLITAGEAVVVAGNSEASTSLRGSSSSASQRPGTPVAVAGAPVAGSLKSLVPDALPVPMIVSTPPPIALQAEDMDARNLPGSGDRRPTSLPPPPGIYSSQPPLPIPAEAGARPGRSFEGSEAAFLDYIVGYAEESGLSFPRSTIETTYLSLKVRPLVILAGPSGIGKTSLARVMWETAGASLETLDAIRIAVEAHWTDARYLLGRQVHGEGYVETDLLQLVRRAAKYPDRQYHALVDEMNLAHVEYYFAQFLSAMEADGRVVLPDLPTPDCHLQMPMVDGWLPLIQFYGTINVDETTQIISDKVIDRANVIELEAQAPGEAVQPRKRGAKVDRRWHLTTEHLKRWGTLEGALKVPEAIRDAWQVLANAHASVDWNRSNQPTGAAPRLAFGHRIVNDIATFVAYAERLGGPEKIREATDWQVKQRILPKLRGDLRIRGALEALHSCLKRHALKESQERLQRMLEQLDHDQFVTFWD
ncbi:MAG: Hsp70 family protein [Byssovorax sp.]